MRAYVLYAVTIFLSAFLLFLIQPMIGKHLLPYFGGASAVWATGMLFFTGMLFAGYAYVYYLTRRPPVEQAKLHLALLGAGTMVVLVSFAAWGSLVPPLEWAIASTLPPALLTLLALMLAVGAPFFLLATTGPLLQYWYGISSSREPYKLYAISNAGSFLALIAYPFLIEPSSTLGGQEIAWVFSFCVYAACAAYAAWGVKGKEGDAQPAPAQQARHASSPAGDVRDPASAPSASGLATGPQPRLTTSTWRETAIWIFYAALPSLVLVATTTEITQVIAPIPLLWILPLALYLLTFIIAFSGIRLGAFSALLLFAASALAWWYLRAPLSEMHWKILASLGLLFAAGLASHMELYRLRPATSALPRFYLYVSLGGMLGALCAGFLAPIVFNDYWEFPLSIAISAVLAVYLFARGGAGEGWMHRITQALAYGIVGLIAAIGISDVRSHNDDSFFVERNFYGTAKVQEDDTTRTLMNGGTVHGYQSLDPERATEPSSYYVKESGAGRAITFARREGKGTLSLGVLGLGAGTLASYCEEDDTIVFYEIDPKILRIAEEQFSYLAQCPQADIRIGDGRVLLSREDSGEKYDVIVMDAFNDDTIPVHLLTREAIEAYLTRLSGESGIIAVHISNRYLDLRPPMMRVASDLGLSFLLVDTVSESDLASGSIWVLLSPGQDTFAAKEFEGVTGTMPEPAKRAWTDSYSDILSILDF